jgi:SAM-dependent methyltransferase
VIDQVTGRSRLEPTTYWERIATTKWGQYTSQVEEQAILQAHRLAPEVRTVLEVGCEGGRWSRMLSDLGWDVVCTDIDTSALDICQERIPSANCILVDPTDSTLPCETESLGLILCVEVYPVLESQWFLPEAHRTLARGGLIVGVALNKRSLRGLAIKARDLRRPPDVHGYRHYQISYSSWKKEAQEQGFEMLHERGFCWFPFRRDSNSSLVPAFTRLERALRLPRLPALSPWIVFIAQKRR